MWIPEILPRTVRHYDGVLVFRLQFSWSWQESEFSWGFIHFIDAEFEFESFSDVLLLCARDVVTGLDYLHSHNIAHRDLKLGNTLVFNQHYITMDGDWAKVYAACPIVCKLADFGLSRSPHMQTTSFLQTRTESTCRGTPVFMAPEIYLENLRFAGQEDLKKADIWSLGLMMFAIINPNLTHPYSDEFERSGISFSDKALTDFLKRQELPCHDNKYEYFRITQWWQIKLGRLCFHFLYDDILLFFFVVHQIHRAKRPTSKLFFYTYISPFETRKINRRFSFLHETQ